MKKFLLKIALCATALLAVGGVATPLFVNAEETQKNAIESVVAEELENVPSDAETNENQTEIVQETETSKWFDETIKPLLIEYGAMVAAGLSAAAICLKKIKKAKEIFDSATGVVEKSNADNKEIKRLVEDFKNEVLSGLGLVADALKEIREGVEEKVIDVDEIVHKLLDVERLAYGSNAALVSNGTAKRIAEVIDHGKAHDEK